MLIYPAIDLKDGCVVRYVQGKLDKKVYSRDPVKTAKHWVKQGAEVLHVVDLDGAFSGVQKNIGVVREITKNVDVPVQFGGGMRSMPAIQKALDFGAWRVVLGTKAAEDSAFLKKALKKFGNKIIVSLDAREGKVLTKGWQSAHKGLDATKFALSLKALGFKEIIYTDTSKDGMLSGPNIKSIKGLLTDTGLHVIASGGISALEDIYKLKMLEKKGVSGVIVGKALYEGRFTLKEALKFS
jgi:phosphoribosylformimino-5-aminoimidazole carboxamide ribotide isomerase